MDRVDGVLINSLSSYVEALERRWSLVNRPTGTLPPEYKLLNDEMVSFERKSGIPLEVFVQVRNLARYFYRKTPHVRRQPFNLLTFLLSRFFVPAAAKPWGFAITMGPVRYDSEDPSFRKDEQMERIMRTADQVETFRVTGGTDNDGNTVDLGAVNKPEWAVSSGDPEVVKITASEDGLSAEFKYEKTGTAVVSIVSKDADGKPIVERSVEVEVGAGKLSGFAISSDGPSTGE